MLLCFAFFAGLSASMLMAFCLKAFCLCRLGMALGWLSTSSCFTAASMKASLLSTSLPAFLLSASASACDCQNSCVQGLLKNISIMDFYRLVFAQSLQNTFVQTFTPYDASARFLPPSLHKTSFKDFLHTWLFKDICMRDSKDIVSGMSIKRL